MRYIPSNCLRPGQILASNLEMDGRKVMLRKGVQLSELLIKRIELLGFQGVYIIDDLSRDLEVADVISDTLKHKAKQEIKTMFISVENKTETRALSQLDMISKVIGDIVDEILYNRNIMVNVVDLRTFDDYTFSHSVNVAVLSVMMGTVLGLNRNSLNDLAMGALIHDIGKVFIDKKIINKPSILTPEELGEVRKHSEAGYKYLIAHSQITDDALKAVLLHHEQYNGKGYPTGASGNDIHLFGRIIGVADVFDALTSDRPYRRAMLPSDAIEYILAGYDTMFDPQVVKAFTRKVAPYPIGTCVKLSNDIMGIVVRNYELYSLRPRLRIIHNGKPTSEFIDLATDTSTLNLTIKEIIQI
jgi:HD-GYP domain-containing protein (c-di-GMP phosphodiesterase class II)